MIIILGAGLAGLSASYHLGNSKCRLFEKNNYATGHIHSECIDGFVWDEGPHVSFTTNNYVRELFEANVSGELLEYPVKTSNYFKGGWIPHPAQSNLYAVPQPLRGECLESFLEARSHFSEDRKPANYQEWLEYSFGTTFANTFPAAYTRKYWTTEPFELTTDWVGNRIYFPQIQQVKEGYLAPLNEETHYVKKVRYPKFGGYMSFAQKLVKQANIELNSELLEIDFETKRILFNNGKYIFYTKLICTIPLPILIKRSNAPIEVKKAAEELNCSSVLLINITARHCTARTDNWIYVYDEDKYSTRINCTELLSPNNAPIGKTGIQVEVYFSSYRKQMESNNFIAKKVISELVEMGLIHCMDDVESNHTKWVQWANVIFDHKRRLNQDIILSWLSIYGLQREYDDLEPMTDWTEKFQKNEITGDIILAGRFAQWKYYWTDDCILRGKLISENATN